MTQHETAPLTPQEFADDCADFLVPNCKTPNYLVPLLVTEVYELERERDLEAIRKEIGDILFSLLTIPKYQITELGSNAWACPQGIAVTAWNLYSAPVFVGRAELAEKLAIIRRCSVALLDIHAKVIRAPEQEEKRVAGVHALLSSLMLALAAVANFYGCDLAFCAQLCLDKLAERRNAGSLTNHNVA